MLIFIACAALAAALLGAACFWLLWRLSFGRPAPRRETPVPVRRTEADCRRESREAMEAANFWAYTGQPLPAPDKNTLLSHP